MKGVWLLYTSIIGNYIPQKTQWWEAPTHTELQPHPLASFSNFRKTWDNLTTNIDWRAPRGLYWIMGSKLIWATYQVDWVLHVSPQTRKKILEYPYIKKD
jgi:hypothetical protein